VKLAQCDADFPERKIQNTCHTGVLGCGNNRNDFRVHGIRLTAKKTKPESDLTDSGLQEDDIAPVV
jgi:hypothetical protein